MVKKCGICDKPMGLMTGKVKIATGDYVCKSCIKLAGLSTLSTSEISKISAMNKRQIQQKIKMRKDTARLKENFHPTEKCGIFAYFDDNSRIGVFKTGKFDMKPKAFIPYKDIEDFKATEDDDQIVKSGLGLAAAGGLIWGPTGAIVGAITGKGRKGKSFTSNLEITLVLKSGNKETIHFISDKTKHNSLSYKSIQPQFQQMVDKLEVILKENNRTTNDSQQFDSADEIRKFKSLLDEGIISQEEFDKKKMQLLRQ
ncbi:SHOCT domain-containing protein [uncultured Enterococcus sp.]|uniref:SHOCT domain-containing protein n=1 Tax=uncultured Enterococcus sp. TaxID=167972 RepID=UPI002AA8C7C8|nr:SHOCT domain-containing protein [uncultured Enterococcus sp.]